MSFMKKYFISNWIVLFVVLSVMACGKDAGEVKTDSAGQPGIVDQKSTNSDSIVVNLLPKTRNIELTQEQKELADKNNDFSFRLYREINKSNGVASNICSPLSVTYVLGMLNDGASGVTTEEIQKVLGFEGTSKVKLNEFCHSLIQQAPIADPSVDLQIANIVAANQNLALENTFEQELQTYYEAEIASLDFSKTSSLDYLNSWCNEKSKGMIPSIIENLDPKSKLIAMNAISFRATWMEKFDKKDTKEERFNVSTGNSVTLPMMSRNAEILYNKNDLYSTIRLPFGSGDIYSMYVLLPAEGKTTSDVINNLSNAEWKSQNMQNTLVDIKLPRFTVVNEIILNDIIAQMGIESMFSPSKADFSLIGKNKEDLYVSLLKQKTAIEVVEDGTKGSSATVAMVDGASTPSMNKATFHCNRPFIYIIQEENSNIIFFIGTFRGV